MRIEKQIQQQNSGELPNPQPPSDELAELEKRAFQILQGPHASKEVSCLVSDDQSQDYSSMMKLKRMKTTNSSLIPAVRPSETMEAI